MARSSRAADVSILVGHTLDELIDMLPTPPSHNPFLQPQQHHHHPHHYLGSNLPTSASLSSHSINSIGSNDSDSSPASMSASPSLNFASYSGSNSPSAANAANPFGGSGSGSGSATAAGSAGSAALNRRSHDTMSTSSTSSVGSSGSASPTSTSSPQLSTSNSSSSLFGSNAKLSEIDEEYFDLLCRTCRGVVHDQDRTKLYSYLTKLHPDQSHALQEMAHQALSENSTVVLPGKQLVKSLLSLKTSKLIVAQTNKHFLDFSLGNRLCPVDEPVHDFIQLSSRKGKEKIKFQFLMPQKDSRWALQIEPLSGIVEKEAFFQKKTTKPQNEDIKVTLTCKTTAHISTVIRMEVEGGPDHFFIINLQTENCLFGVPPTSMTQVSDGNHTVPALLQTLKAYFVQNNGPRTVGIFRGSGEEDQVLSVKRALNRGAFTGTSDIHAIATVIKIWFRDLPEQILNVLGRERIIKCDKKEQCIEAMNSLPEPNRTLLLWLLDLLCMVITFESTNEMNAQKLAICIAPNLFSTPADVSLPPQEHLRLSQAVVNFVQNILVDRFSQPRR